MDTRTVLKVVLFAALVLAFAAAALLLTEPGTPFGTSGEGSTGGGPSIQWGSDSLAR